MSQFLNYYSYLIDIGATVAQFQAEIKTHLTANGWQVVGEKVPVANDANARGILDVIPPASSPIGNGTHMEVTRFVFARSGVSITNYIRTVAAPTLPVFTLTNNASGTSTMTVYMEDASFSFAGTSGYTTAQNAALLLAQLQGSANEYVQMFTYSISGAVITATPVSTSAPMVSFQQAVYNSPSVTVAVSGSDVPLYRHTRPVSQSVACDYTNGFIYFLTVNERSIIIATKTVGNYYGPLCAFYQDRTIALAQTPPGLMPIESVIVPTSAITLGVKTYAAMTHCWGTEYSSNGTTNPYYSYNNISPAVILPNCQLMHTSGAMANLSCWGRYNGYYTNIENGYTGTAEDYSYHLGTPLASVLGIIYGTASELSVALNYTQVLPLASPGVSKAYAITSTVPSPIYYTYIFPPITYEDVLFANFTATSESLHYVKNLQTTSTLQTTMDGTTSYATLDVGDASAFPASGTVIIDSETLEYTSKTGNTLNGITHAKYGTTKAAHAPGATVYVASWLVKINTGLLQAGFNKPTN